MGTWGTAISSNDTYADIYSAFFDSYDEGLSVEEISKKLISSHQRTICDANDANNFWFALAKAQWECKQLDNDVFARVRQIIESGQDLEIWRQLNADEKDLKKRKAHLEHFLVCLVTEKPKAKTRKQKIIRQPVFEKGDCLTFRLANGNYGGAVVLEAIKDTQYGHNLIASTRINQLNKPTKKDFENAEILIINYANWDNKPNVRWYLPLRHNRIAHLIEKVDNMQIQLSYDKNDLMFGTVGDFEGWFIDVANRQFQSELEISRPTIKLKLKVWTSFS